VLTLSSKSVSSPLHVFSQATARRNAARGITVLAQRRSEREDAERFLAALEAHQRRSAAD
jgi:hypothetical protein